MLPVWLSWDLWLLGDLSSTVTLRGWVHHLTNKIGFWTLQYQFVCVTKCKWIFHKILQWHDDIMLALHIPSSEEASSICYLRDATWYWISAKWLSIAMSTGTWLLVCAWPLCADCVHSMIKNIFSWYAIWDTNQLAFSTADMEAPPWPQLHEAVWKTAINPFSFEINVSACPGSKVRI